MDRMMAAEETMAEETRSRAGHERFWECGL